MDIFKRVIDFFTINEDDDQVQQPEPAVTIMSKNHSIHDRSSDHRKNEFPSEPARKNDVPVTADNNTTPAKSNSTPEADQKKSHSAVVNIEYTFPSVQILDKKAPTRKKTGVLEEQGQKLIGSLQSFGVSACLVNSYSTPFSSVYEIMPESGVSIKIITNLQKDLSICMGSDIFISISGKQEGVVDISVTSDTPSEVKIRELISKIRSRRRTSIIPITAGIDSNNDLLEIDLTKAHHLLIGGTTGSGKSVLIHDIIVSILFLCDPADVKLILIDPRQIELNRYAGIPHLLTPVATSADKCLNILKWTEAEMNKRYQTFAVYGAKDIDSYNNAVKSQDLKLPRIVIIIDEYGDLMFDAPKELEETLCNLARKARSAGIHLIISTQRPGSEVITASIKANFPSRIAFSVMDWHNSQTILNVSGAEDLRNSGEFLYMTVDSQKPIHARAPYLSDEEIERVVSTVSFPYSTD